MRKETKMKLRMSSLVLLVSLAVAGSAKAATHTITPTLAKVHSTTDGWHSARTFGYLGACDGPNDVCFSILDQFWYDNVDEIQMQIQTGDSAPYASTCWYFNHNQRAWQQVSTGCRTIGFVNGLWYLWWKQAGLENWDYRSDFLGKYMAYGYRDESYSPWKYVKLEIATIVV